MMSKWFNRIVAGILILTLAFVSPMQFVGSEAAGKNVKYIKEFKLFIKKEGTQADAENWCKSQTDGDWHVVDGDLNGGTDATFTKPVGVFMCYCTTENEKEAVRNIAVMNEKGNYSENAYQEILKSQKSVYKDLVNDLKIQVKGYQENLKNKVNTAVRTHDLLNGYREDDSGKLLGDLLAELDLDQEKDADKLTDILLQANGDVVLFIQQELSLACENAKRSWLDRMVQAGGYDKFYAKIKTAFNGDDSLAKKNMDIKYKEKATVIADDWDNLKSHLNHIKEYEEQNGVSSMSEEQLKTWKVNNLKSPNGAIYEQEVALAYNLANYKYEGKTLLDFFSQDKSEISEKNLYKLYPMVACLQDGQFAGLDSTVNLYSLINQAFSATLLNDYDKGLLKEVKDEMNEEQKKSLSTAQKNLESITDKQTDKEVKSIYEGVNREIFNGGVAVTSDALKYSNGAETKWQEKLYNNLEHYNTCAILSLVGGIIGAIFFNGLSYTLLDKVAITAVRDIYDYGSEKISEETVNFISRVYEEFFHSETTLIQIEDWARKGNEEAQTALSAIYKTAKNQSTSFKILHGLAIGLSVIMILITIADIAVNVYGLYQYYNMEHLPIPKYMVDLSTDRNKETTYITYKSVPDNDGNPGDLNGRSSKEWLALYQTYDERAGAPIAAPESGYVMRVCSDGDYDYERGQSALHLFGISDSERTNLTSTEWSYNDKNGKTFFIYSHYDGKIIEEESVAEKDKEEKETVSEASSESVSGNAVDVANPETEVVEAEATQTGTAMSGGVIILIAVCAMGVVIAFVVAVGYSRKKKKGMKD